MTWSVPLDRIAAKTGARMETVARKVAFELFGAVVRKSPVDTGRFRANWNVSYGDASVTTTASTNQSRALTEVSKTLTLPVGGVMYLANGLPYAVRLENGYSKQAPVGMVRTSLAEYSLHVNKALS